MTIEFGDLARSYLNKLKPRPTYREIESNYGIDKSKLSRVLDGLTEPKPKDTILLANILQVPQESRAEFYLLAGGFSPEATSQVLNEYKDTQTE